MEFDLANGLYLVASLYFMGNKVAQHQKAEEFVATLDRGLVYFLFFIKDQKPVNVIKFSANLFGIVAAIGFVGIILLGTLNIQSYLLVNIFSVALVGGGLLSGSLWWALHHKEVVKHFAWLGLLFGGMSLLMPVMDFLSGTNMTQMMSTMLSYSLSPVINFTPSNGLLEQTMYIAGTFCGFFLFLYVISWVYAAPTALFACIVIALPIWAARLINRVFPKEPIVIVFLIFWLYAEFFA
ncbi:TPA: hypothetical protein NJY92_004576 [Vibrio parahaemolyticus]|nr:hypothetical protein [Vibrio parahaemolyticus]HCG5229056.1 hypothetical protein [Vibrio parahaemolyticus]